MENKDEWFFRDTDLFGLFFIRNLKEEEYNIEKFKEFLKQHLIRKYGDVEMQRIMKNMKSSNVDESKVYVYFNSSEIDKNIIEYIGSIMSGQEQPCGNELYIAAEFFRTNYSLGVTTSFKPNR